MLRSIEPPWSDEQVEQLNRFQRAGYMHPFTCPDPGTTRKHGGNVSLVAEPDGWHCPDRVCDYTQTWAHEFMTDKDWMDDQDEFWANLRKKDES